MSPVHNKSIFVLNLELSQARMIMEALAEQPFKYVFELIGKLNSQANKTAVENPPRPQSHSFELTAREIELIISSLGEMPYKRVQSLVEIINSQLREQSKRECAENINN